MILHENNNHNSNNVAWVQDGQKENSKMIIGTKDVFDKHVVLSKAKAAGVHTNVYSIKNSYDNMTPDYDWTIY